MGPSTNVAVLHTFQLIRIQLHDFANLHAEPNEPKNLETMQVIESLLFKNFKNLPKPSLKLKQTIKERQKKNICIFTHQCLRKSLSF